MASLREAGEERVGSRITMVARTDFAIEKAQRGGNHNERELGPGVQNTRSMKIIPVLC